MGKSSNYAVVVNTGVSVHYDAVPHFRPRAYECAGRHENALA